MSKRRNKLLVRKYYGNKSPKGIRGTYNHEEPKEQSLEDLFTKEEMVLIRQLQNKKNK